MYAVANEQDVDILFREIVTICKHRLLIRLRSSHAKTHRKADRSTIILKVLDGVRLLKDLPTVPHQLAFVDTQATLLGAAFMSLETLSSTAAHSEPGTQLLKTIVLTIDRILSCTNIAALLEMIPKNISSRSGPAGQSLAKSLTSLAQYCHAAQYLLRRSPRNPIFHSLSVAEVPFGPFRESSVSAEPHSVPLGIFNRPIKGQQIRQASEISTKLKAILRKSRAEIELGIRKHAVQ